MTLQNAINLVINSSNPLSAANGGLGVSDPTAHGILVAEGSSAVNPIVLTNGQMLLGSTGADPVAATLTSGGTIAFTTGAGSLSLDINTVTVANGGTGLTSLTAHGILVGEGTSNVNPIVLTNGQLLIGSTGADPSAATLTAGTGISITNAAGSITIAATGASPWVDVTGTSATLAAGHSYSANNAGLVTLTLPATAAFGDEFEVIATGAGLFTIAQNAGQSIRFGNVVSTAGTGGSISATSIGDSIRIVCNVANTGFQVVFADGNLSVA